MPFACTNTHTALADTDACLVPPLFLTIFLSLFHWQCDWTWHDACTCEYSSTIDYHFLVSYLQAIDLVYTMVLFQLIVVRMIASGKGCMNFFFTHCDYIWVDACTCVYTITMTMNPVLVSFWITLQCLIIVFHTYQCIMMLCYLKRSEKQCRNCSFFHPYRYLTTWKKFSHHVFMNYYHTSMSPDDSLKVWWTLKIFYFFIV